ncbi:SDR family oxidoreductase [Streptomyces sp. NPDC001709]
MMPDHLPTDVPTDVVDDPNAVAVVGLSCRFGPATSTERLWELLSQGRSGIRRYTADELVRMGHDATVVRRPEFVPAGVVLEDADAFDAEFFGYSPVHAEWLDPQQRVLLETAWHALEDAGFAPDRTGLRTSAYVSVGQPTMPPVGITELDAAGMIRFSSSDKDFAASRISYKLGLTGPSLTVQSACSSALVGVHLAVEGLLGEECDLALVGAASLHFPQAGYLAAPDMILSPSGACRPFDDSADGTVFGNGAGALVLRRLSDALRDGDPIRAVIRGSAVNNDGARKMDYHAPSPEGQEAVLREALAVAGVDAHSVGYLETHGTGTHLGDPIEYAALDRVYGGAERAHPAAVGSVKSVVGHLNTAAGIAGLAKAVLALEHGTVPAQAPFESPNRRLGGSGSLKVADGKEGWPVPEGPRRAAVSSFGIGGTNAHVVLEQAPQPAPVADAAPVGEHWAVLSARTEHALRELAASLAHALRTRSTLRLADVTHTLRTGRSHRTVRAAVAARSTAELAERFAVVAEQGPQAITADLSAPYRAWVHGDGELPSAENESQARRVRLPGYPFTRKRWPRPQAPSPGASAPGVSGSAASGSVASASGASAPDASAPDASAPAASASGASALGVSASGASAPAAVAAAASAPGTSASAPAAAVPAAPADDASAPFQRVVRPEEPLADDHRVAGLPVLPAAAQIDLALTAGARRLGRPVTGLADIAFHRTIEVTGPVTLRVETEGDQVRVLSQETTQQTQQTQQTHAQARLLTDTASGRPEPLDLAALRGACSGSADPAGLYRYFEENGVGYGPAFRVLQELRHGPDGVLARVCGAPEGGTVSPYVLDGALQSVIGCVLHEDLGGETFIPFAMDDLRLYGPVPAEAWVRVRPHNLAGGGRRVRKFDVTLAAADGTVLLTIKGLALRPVPAPAPAADGIHLFAAAETEVEPAEATGPYDGPLVVIGDVPLDDPAFTLPAPLDPQAAADLGTDLAGRLPDGGRPLIVWPQGAEPDAGAGAFADRAAASHGLRTLALLRSLLRPLSRRGARVVVPYPADTSAGQLTGRALAAVGRSLTGENPRFELTAVSLAEGTTDAELARAVRTAAEQAPASRHLSLAADGRLTATVLAPLTRPTAPAAAFRHGGRYWINGMGRLAVLLAEHLLDRYAARVVLTGRSAADGERGAELRRLADRAARTGGTVDHRQVDTTDAAAMRAAAREIAASGPAVDGVFHCAGTLRDGYILRKTTDDAREVITPKLTGAAALDEATAEWALDCFVVFSSVSAALGSAGQADYAFANAAADELTRRRAARGGSGRSLSVGWPYWADGGMQLDGPAQDVLGELGMRPLDTAAGFKALESLLAGDEIAPVVLCGDRAALLESFPLLQDEPVPAATGTTAPQAAAPAPTPTPAPAGPAIGGSVQEALHRRLSAVVAEATRTPEEEVHADRLFDDLGIDSLLAIRVVELLERDFGRLSKTLLFECRSVEELAEYLMEELPERCAALAAPDEPPAPAPAAEAVPAAVPVHAPDPAPAPVPAVGEAEAPSSAQEAETDADADARSVAIIGISGRFPQADSLDAFWKNLTEGRDSITEVPADRWDAQALYDADKNRVDRTHTKWGGFVDGVEKFDAALFNISPREAGIVDPQARLFLESCWSALDDAGYTPDALVTADDPIQRRDVGVFVGAMYGEYQLHEAEERLRGNPVLANSAYWSIANRVSYFFDFQGPSVAVDTACSSALTAVHLAVESLRAGSSKVAIAGGVNVLIHPNKYFMLGQGRFASSDGRCRSFGAGGDGYVPGEGVGAVVLKPLRDALRDGDHIHGVIRGTSANHGGRTNGYTVPNPRAQADLVTKALRDGGLTAGDLDYLEAHGTGTSLGDPIEIRGLTTAFSRDGIKGPGSLPIGSVKSNVGHLESAAGSVALTKVLLQMRHRTLVPSLHATPANPEIDFDGVPFTVQQQLAPWNTRDGSDRPLRAGIGSFGAGGGNAYLVVEEAPRRVPAPAPAVPQPLVLLLSARTDSALAAYARDLAAYLRQARDRGEAPEPADVVFTFAVGRADLARRAALPADSLEELLSGLTAVAEGRSPQPVAGPTAATVTDWLAGRRIDRRATCGAADHGHRIPLPHYPFERIRCWYDRQITHLRKQGYGLTADEPSFTRGHLRDFGRTPQERAELAAAEERAKAPAGEERTKTATAQAATATPSRPTPPPSQPTPAPVTDIAAATAALRLAAATPPPAQASASPASPQAQAANEAQTRPSAALNRAQAQPPARGRASAQLQASAQDPTNGQAPAPDRAQAPAPDRAQAPAPARGRASVQLRTLAQDPANGQAPASTRAQARDRAQVPAQAQSSAPAAATRAPAPDRAQASAQARPSAALNRAQAQAPAHGRASAQFQASAQDPTNGQAAAPDRAAAPALAHGRASVQLQALAQDPGNGEAPASTRAQVPAGASAQPSGARRSAPALTLRGARATPRKSATPDIMETSPMTRDRKISLRPLDTAPRTQPAPVPAAVTSVPAAAAPIAPVTTPTTHQEAAVAEEIGSLLAGVLYLEPGELDRELTFQDLGIDSILGVEFVAAVNAAYPVEVKATALYDHPTPVAFAQYVAGLLGNPAQQPAPAAPTAPSATVTPVADAGHIADTLREELARTLYCEPGEIDDEASFNTLGLDSILGVEFVAFVNNAYGLVEKTGVLYDHPSLNALSRHIATLTAPAPAAQATAPAADLDALLSAVRDNRLTVEQALALLPQNG